MIALVLCLTIYLLGIVTIGEGLTRSFAGLVVCRVLLGALEAGYFPGEFAHDQPHNTHVEVSRISNPEGLTVDQARSFYLRCITLAMNSMRA